MRYFLDSEFVEDGKTIDLISIGLVCEDGRAFYCISKEFDFLRAWNDVWIRENVLRPIYQESDSCRDDFNLERAVDVIRRVGRSRAEIAEAIYQFLAYEAISDGYKEATKCSEDCYAECLFWTPFGSHEWVAFLQLLGSPDNLPEDLPTYCQNIKQLRMSLGNPDIPTKRSDTYNILEAALWLRDAWVFLNKIESNRKQYYRIEV